MGRWEDGKMGRWEDGKMGRWEDGKMGRWEDGKMGRWEDGKMGRWEDGKMGRWEDGKYKTIETVARKENADKSRVAKLIRLTCLAPDIQEAILCNTGTWGLTLKDCMKPFPMPFGRH